MDPAIQMLYREHRLIERIVGVLGKLAALLMEGAELPLSHLEECLALMRQCTDGYHHGKEEKILFPMLVEQSRYRLRVPVGMLNREHEIGRGHVRQMAKAAAEGLAAEGREVFSRHAIAYQTMLRMHIRKEDKGLFPTADKALDGEAKQELSRRFDQFEEAAPEHLEDYQGRVEELEKCLWLKRE